MIDKSKNEGSKVSIEGNSGFPYAVIYIVMQR